MNGNESARGGKTDFENKSIVSSPFPAAIFKCRLLLLPLSLSLSLSSSSPASSSASLSLTSKPLSSGAGRIRPAGYPNGDKLLAVPANCCVQCFSFQVKQQVDRFDRSRWLARKYCSVADSLPFAASSATSAEEVEHFLPVCRLVSELLNTQNREESDTFQVLQGS